jgi:hypothetical protein
LHVLAVARRLSFLSDQLSISNQVPIPEPIIGKYSPPPMKPIIDIRINSTPATAIGGTLLRIVFNDISDDASGSREL